MTGFLSALGAIVVVVLFITRIATGPLTWIWKKKPASMPRSEPEIRHTPPIFRSDYFLRGWDRLMLPILGVVGIVDHGHPGVGLSAMQMRALGVGRGLVRLEFNGRTCEAKVWNACGPDTMHDYRQIRITDSIVEKLGCGVGDEIKFVEVLAANLPVAV